MATTSKQPRVVGYNVQNVVETKHHLIVAHEVTNLGYDREALSMMAHPAKEVMASDTIEAIADKGYYKGEEIVAAEQAGVAVIVSKPNTSNAGARGRFDKADFTYLAEENAYLCPAGERLTYRFTNEEAEGQCTHTGLMPARRVRSSTIARRGSSVVSSGGSMRRSLNASKGASMTIPRRSRCEAKPSSTHSERSRHGWAPRTSR
jgi:hypothetical protein